MTTVFGYAAGLKRFSLIIIGGLMVDVAVFMPAIIQPLTRKNYWK